ELRISQSAQLLAVVVWTRAAREETEAVAHALELRPERVRDGGLEPADRAGAPPGQQDPVLPRLAKHLVEPVRAPDPEGVRRVPARHENDVVAQRQLPDVAGRIRKEMQVRHLGAPADALVPRDG